jgi:hypothetical protein
MWPPVVLYPFAQRLGLNRQVMYAEKEFLIPQLLSVMSNRHPMDFFKDVAGTFPQDSDVFKMMMEKYFRVSGDTFGIK